MEQKLDNYCSVINGGAWSDDEYVDHGIPVLRVSNMVGGTVVTKDDKFLPEVARQTYSRHELSEKDILIATVGSHPNQQGSVVGRTSRVPQDWSGAYLNQNAACLRVNDTNKVEPNFFWHLTKTVLFKHHIESRARGSANQVRMAIGELKKFEFDFPSLRTQRKIAAILTAYDDLIEINKRRIALLEKMTEELYREWFVRLRFPGYQDARFVKGVPEGWPFDVGTVFFDHIKGKSYASHEISDEDGTCFFITLKSFHRRGGYRKEGLKYFSGSYKEGQCVKAGDVVMAVTDMTQDRAVVGEVARIPCLHGKNAVISLDVIRLMPKNMSTTFLYSYMRYSGFANYIKEFANGANVLHLKPDLIGKQKLLFPPAALRDKFSSLVEPFYQEMDALEEANGVFTKTRDLLLPRLISGKLSVEDLDTQFPPSMQQGEAAAQVEQGAMSEACHG